MSLAADVAETVSHHDVLLCAEPGAGKSTGLPLALLHASSGNTNSGNANIILLEPRRLAARAVASRLAAHLGEPIGQRIGLRMRSDTRVSADTQLTVVTEGVLTRMLQHDPALEGVGLVIFDEFHERSLHADLGLALYLEVQQALRDDLRLLLMSATLDATPLSTRMNNVVQFQCAVRQHPVDTYWEGKPTGALEQQIVSTTLKALDQHEGDVLVFLPGVAEINRSARLLEPRLSDAIELHRLHSGVSLADQKKATGPASPQVRRVILSTSLAETSVTIDGVTIVVDSGLERRGAIDTATGAQRLETVMSSQASATQRAGRAGRTSAGHCYRLWDATAHSQRARHWQPEILRADLAPLVLELALWGATSPDDLDWLDTPPTASVARAQDLLTHLGLWQDGQLTQRGRRVAALPVHPRLGNMLAWAQEHGAIAQACRLAAVLDEPGRRSATIDLEPVLEDRLSKTQQRKLGQLTQALPPSDALSQQIPAAILLAQAYPDWIAQARSGRGAERGAFRLACGAGVCIDTDDALAHAEWLVVLEMGGTGKQLRVFRAIELNIKDLEVYSPEQFKTVERVTWNDKEQRVTAERQFTLGRFVVSAETLHEISDEQRSAVLLAGIKQTGLKCLPWTDETREWQARVQRMHTLKLPAQQTRWPHVDDQTLTDTLDTWLLPWLVGISSLKSLHQLNMHKILHSMLDYAQQKLLDEYLPVRYQVPSGSNIALSYVNTDVPKLSVRLQEMLGCIENPSIANAQIILKVELLSPARRPVQVTTDLKGFWNNSYPEVKKEMAGRYPKHVWPDDPMNAQATTRTKGR